jgi:hypothetical protein
MTKPVKRTLWAVLTTLAIAGVGYVIVSRVFSTHRY